MGRSGRDFDDLQIKSGNGILLYRVHMIGYNQLILYYSLMGNKVLFRNIFFML